eukprot:1860587-Amphidinium_carterae.1
MCYDPPNLPHTPKTPLLLLLFSGIWGCLGEVRWVKTDVVSAAPQHLVRETESTANPTGSADKNDINPSPLEGRRKAPKVKEFSYDE